MKLMCKKKKSAPRSQTFSKVEQLHISRVSTTLELIWFHQYFDYIDDNNANFATLLLHHNKKKILLIYYMITFQ